MRCDLKLALAAGIKIGIYYAYNIQRAAKKKRAAAKSPMVRTVANGVGPRARHQYGRHR